MSLHVFHLPNCKKWHLTCAGSLEGVRQGNMAMGIVHGNDFSWLIFLCTELSVMDADALVVHCCDASLPTFEEIDLERRVTLLSAGVQYRGSAEKNWPQLAVQQLLHDGILPSDTTWDQLTRQQAAMKVLMKRFIKAMHKSPQTSVHQPTLPATVAPPMPPSVPSPILPPVPTPVPRPVPPPAPRLVPPPVPHPAPPPLSPPQSYPKMEATIERRRENSLPSIPARPSKRAAGTPLSGVRATTFNARSLLERDPAVLQRYIVFHWNDCIIQDFTAVNKTLRNQSRTLVHIAVDAQVVGSYSFRPPEKVDCFGKTTFQAPFHIRRLQEFRLEVQKSGEVHLPAELYREENSALVLVDRCSLQPMAAWDLTQTWKHTCRISQSPPYAGAPWFGTVVDCEAVYRCPLCPECRMKEKSKDSKDSQDQQMCDPMPDHYRIKILKDNEKEPQLLLIENKMRSLKDVWNNPNAPLSTSGESGESMKVLLEFPNGHAQGTLLFILHEGSLVDAEVLSWERIDRASCHSLLLGSTTPVVMDLNPLNAFPRHIDSVHDYMQAYQEFCTLSIEQHGTLTDALTGMELRTEDQLLNIGTSRKKGLSLPRECGNVLQLAGHVHQRKGCPPFLISAAAGTGKTWSAVQLVHRLCVLSLSNHCGMPVVPLLVHVQQLVLLSGDQLKNPAFHNLLLDYAQKSLLQSHPSCAQLLNMLRQAFEMRAVVVLLDGVDEASDKREIIARLAHNMVRSGLQVIVTSRPEGVHLEDFTKQFVVLDLMPLTMAQQTDALMKQLKMLDPESQRFLEHYLQFAHIRSGHDQLWQHELWDEREKVQALYCEDKFLRRRAYDPALRQRNVDGTRVVQECTGAPQSIYLQELHAELSPLFCEDPNLKQMTPEHEALLGSRAKKVVVRLRNLAQREGRTMADLWTDIVSRTDEIYVVVEALWPAVERFMRECEGPGTTVIIGPNKDPVRLYEKALDDYATRFSDGLRESCVADVIRARAVCSSLQDILKLHERLVSSKECDDAVSVRVVRLKNKFSPGTLDPTHFRNLLYNCQLTAGSTFMLFEMQVHLKKILEHNETLHAHTPYEYFRSLFSAKYQDEMDAMLEKMLLFFEELRGVPVLLSMLVLTLRNTKGAMESMPTNRFQLYEQALVYAVKEALQSVSTVDHELVMKMLRTLALANQSQKRRLFSMSWACETLDPGELNVWKLLRASPQELPLLKTLQTSLAGSEDLFQFRHLSFQEALCCQALVSNDCEGFWNDGILRTMEEPFHENTFRIGGESIGRAVAHRFDKALSLKAPSNQMTAAFDLTKFFQFLSVSELHASRVPDQSLMHTIVDGLHANQTIAVLDLSNNRLQAEAAIHLAKSLKHNTALKKLYLGNNSIGCEGASALAGALRVNTTIRILDLTFNGIRAPGGTDLVEALQLNTTLHTLKIADNQMGDRISTALMHAAVRNRKPVQAHDRAKARARRQSSNTHRT